jgi:hypothetical protein
MGLRFGNFVRSERTGRIFSALLGLLLIIAGIGSIFSGTYSYRNYWGGIVFGPFAITGGIMLLLIVTFCRRKIWAKDNGRKKFNGKAARKARKAENYRAAIDDFDKPWGGGA